MARPEREKALQFITNRFDTAIYGIRDAGVPGISRVAQRAVDAIKFESTPVRLGSPAAPAAVSFATLQVYQDNVTLFRPIISVNPYRMMSIRTKLADIQGDVVRTLAIADSFPFGGYERRMVDVYMDGLNTEEKWLNHQNERSVQNDPRTEDKKEIAKRLLGSRYYVDCGFADWQAAIDKQLALGHFPEASLRALRDDRTTFAFMREAHQDTNFQTAVSVNREAYFKLSEDERAEASATIYLGLALVAQDAGSN